MKNLRADWIQGILVNVKIKTCKTLTFPVILYGCETSSSSLRVSENRVLSRISGPKTEEITGAWNKRYNKEPNNLYFSPNIIRVIRSRRIL
jgi:hypothetical protein